MQLLNPQITHPTPENERRKMWGKVTTQHAAGFLILSANSNISALSPIRKIISSIANESPYTL
jgi:hypothetical protein